MSDDLLERFPEEDEEFLRSKGAKLFEGPGLIYVVFEDEPLGSAYDPDVTNVMFQVPFGYPGAAMDMFWTSPHVKLVSTSQDPQQCSHFENHMGATWQRWSRHINWRAGVDNVQTFYRAFRTEIALGR
jgi:hypothetical protein